MSEKIASADHPVHELLKKRWSPRAFADRSLKRDSLHQLFEAARWAPSSYNEQPWYFVIARREQTDEFEAILRCLVEGNRIWAKSAPLLGIAVARLTFVRNGKPNPHAVYDLGQAVAHLTFAATDLGLFVHQMAGFDPVSAQEALRIPEGFAPITAFAVGYLGNPDDLPAPLQQMERTPRQRKPAHNFVFSGLWNQPFDSEAE